MKSFFLISILITAIIFGGLSFNQAFAHQDAPGVSAPGVGASSSIIPAGTALNGAVVNSKMILSNVTGSNAFDGGFITITNPDGTKLIVNSPSGTVVPCIGGTATTNGADTDHIGSATDCLPTLKIFPSQLRSYQVKCSDDGKNGDPPADGVLRWTFNYTGFSHRNALDNLSASALIQNELDCAFSLYTFTTDSNKKSTQTSPVSNLNDTVTITGVADLAGNFTTSAVLNPPTGADVTATCVTTPALNVIPLPLTVKCTVPGSYTAPGLYCWDVTVAETGVNYDSSSDKTQAGASDATHECFTLVSLQWSASTLSNYHGEQTAPVVNPTDTITVNADASIGGTFTATFDIYNSTGIVNSGTCTGGVVDGTTGKATLTCDAIGTFADKTADTCFNELVTAPAPYTPTTKTLLGADDPNNECFRIQGSSGFFTGGGRVDVPGSVDSVVKTSGKGPTQKVTPTTYKLTHGFELHCDAASGPNNLEINWLQSQFHLEQLVTAECVDDGSTNEPPPSADTKTNGHGPTLDVYYGVGYGRYNGECGAKAEWVMDDNGEPGKADQIVALRITVGGVEKLSINPGELVVRDTSGSGTWKNPGPADNPLWLNLVTGNHQFTPHQTGTHGPTQTNPCPAVAP